MQENPRESAAPTLFERIRRHLALVCGLAVALPPAWIVLEGAWRSTWSSFGRDQGIFQYVAWAIAQGERAYVDFREINGPFIHVLHLVLLPFVGDDEHRFRVFDVLLSGLVWTAVGASLPGIGRRRGEPSAAPTAATRAVWGAASCIVFFSQYLLFDFWQHAQRESFYVLFLLASLALQLHAQSPAPPGARRLSPTHAMFFAGLLNAATWFGKPTCGLFAIAQLAAFLVDDEREIAPAPALRSFGLGALVSSLVFVGFVAVVGDLSAGVRMILVEAPGLYRFIWHKSFAECYSVWNNGPKLNYAFVTLGASVALLAARVLPRRFLGPVSFLAVGLVTFFLQGKGFPYHLHPVTTGTHLLWLAILVWGIERARSLPAAAVTLVASAALAYQAHTQAAMSPSVRNEWYADARAQDPGAPERLYRRFQDGDYFPWDMRQAAAYVDSVTSTDDRVQTYGMDPYFLFLARRRSATPYMYSFELNVDAALEGTSGRRPDERERAWILDRARNHERELLAALERRPPAAFVSIDKAPFTFPADADVDFAQHCPTAAAWLRAHFTPAARFGVVHVWLRNDVGERAGLKPMPFG